MRPRGEVRQALAIALGQLHQERGAVSAREVATVAQVAFEHARETLKDMTRAGEVVIVGSAKLAGARWHNLYEPASQEIDETWGSLEALAEVMRNFPARES